MTIVMICYDSGCRFNRIGSNCTKKTIVIDNCGKCEYMKIKYQKGNK